jgi:hypothetical protein
MPSRLLYVNVHESILEATRGNAQSLPNKNKKGLPAAALSLVRA